MLSLAGNWGFGFLMESVPCATGMSRVVGGVDVVMFGKCV